MLPLEPLDHELVLLARGKARPHRLPGAPRPDPAVLRLRDADQALLWGCVDRMVVDRIAELELPGNRMLAREVVRLLPRHQPAPGERLLRAIPEIALIADIHLNRPSCR